MSDYGRETVTILELDVPLCQLEYGTTNAFGTCSASLTPIGSPPIATGDHKCFNTRVTCQDPDAYLPATQIIRFSNPQRGLTQHYDNVFPSLVNLETTAGAINLGGMDRSLSALGVREAVDIAFEDHRWNDHLFDKYRLERITGDASFEQSGTAQAGAASSLTLAATATDVPIGRELRLLTGAGSVQERAVSAYNSATKVATVAPFWRVNEALRSEELDNAAWSKFQSGVALAPTVTSNTGPAPDGSITADRVQFSLNGGTATSDISDVRQSFNYTNGVPSSFGFWLKSNTGVNQLIIIFDFNSQAGLLTVTPEWTFFQRNLTPLSTVASNAGVRLRGGQGMANTADLLVWGGHKQTALLLGDYIKTGAAAVTIPDSTTTYEVRDAYDPYERGTFWGKFLARNPYYAAYRARVKRGFMGDALDDMTTRSYIVDRITGPTNGKARMVLKDLFSLIEERKAVAPVASQGELSAGITAVAGSATLSPAGIGVLEYPMIGSPGMLYVAIGDEVIAATRSGDVLTLTERGALNTVASAHDAEDLVQLVLSFEAELAHDIIYALQTEYAEIPSAEIPKAEWDIFAESMPELYTARITEPTAVRDLIGELCEQAGCTVWHDPGTGLIQFRPLRPTAANVTVTDNEWIVDKSLDMKRQDAKRVSRAIVYFGQKNPTVRLDDLRNYRARVITPDLDAESTTQYGVPSIKVIPSRWIPQFARQVAAAAGDRIVALFRDPPLEASFRLHGSRDGQLEKAQPFYLQTFEAQDDTGAEAPALMVPIEIGRDANEIAIKAQGVTFFTAPADTGVRTIYLDSPDMFNLNLRTIHDSIYQPPTGSEVVEFILVSGFRVGSTSTASPAMRTGNWPAGVALSLATLGGRIQGKGPVGGKGGDQTGSNGSSGEIGGNAFLAEHAISIDNTGGEIWAGGGGGGGGAYGQSGVFLCGGGGGGGGSGTDTGSGGDGGTVGVVPGDPGAASTTEAGGAGGAGAASGSGTGGGNGGAGGDPGFDGSNGGNATFGSGGAGGASGNYISGNSFVTWVANGSRLGGVA